MDASGGGTADLHVDPEQRKRAEAWVAAWDQVPLGPPGEQQRWHVLNEAETVRLAGFATGTAKLALHDGRITRAPGVEVPDAVLGALSPGFRAADDPLWALSALSALSDERSRQGRILRVTGARRGAAEFVTDRGTRLFPSWFLEIEDALGPAVVLDPDVERHSVAGVSGVLLVRTMVSGVASGAGGADGASGADGSEGVDGAAVRSAVRGCRLGADGRTLTVGFVGSPAVYTDYPAGFAVEGRNAVCVVPIAVSRPLARPRRPRTVRLRHLPWHRRPGRAARWFFDTWVLGRRPIVARAALAQQREVTVVLAEPLGDRVVAEAGSGRPLGVESAEGEGGPR